MDEQHELSVHQYGGKLVTEEIAIIKIESKP